MATIAENIQTLRSIKSDIKNAIIQKGGSVTDAFGTYAQAITDLPSTGGGNEDLIDMIEGDITTLNIPEGTTKICKYAFFYRQNLTDITIPDSVITIDVNAFQYCKSLKNVTISESVKSIKNYTFDHCSALTSVNIPYGVKTIGQNAFAYCKALAEVIIPDTVVEIGGSAFNECLALKKVNIPYGVTSIEPSTFSSCSFTDITIPSSVKTIYANAFWQCQSLTDITIPSSVTLIAVKAFADCIKLTSITIKATTPPRLFSNAFDNTNNCPIYVPAESVNAYKTATNWSEYASRIQAIGAVIEGDPSGGPIIN